MDEALAHRQTGTTGDAQVEKNRAAKLHGFAVLVGIERYPALSEREQLRAGRNDVLAFWKLCRRLKLRHEDITVLTSPRLDEQMLFDAEKELFEEDCERSWLDHFPELYPRWKEAKQGRGASERASSCRAEALSVLDRTIRDNVRQWLARTSLTPAEAGSDSPARRLRRGAFLEATHENLRAAIDWLADALALTIESPRTADGDRFTLPCLFHFSGHGANVRGDGGLALCPSDVSRGSGELENTLSFRYLEEAFERSAVAPGGPPVRLDRTLTIFLDCCFAASGGRAMDGTAVATLTPGGPSPRETLVKGLGCRLLCASERGEAAHQLKLDGRWRSAFSWACTTVLERWPVHKPGKGSKRRSSLSHGDLLLRVRILLEALNVPQRPRLMKPKYTNIPLFWHPSEKPVDVLATEPVEAETREGQADPGGELPTYSEYSFLDERGIELVKMIAIPWIVSRTTYEGNMAAYDKEGALKVDKAKKRQQTADDQVKKLQSLIRELESSKDPRSKGKLTLAKGALGSSQKEQLEASKDLASLVGASGSLYQQYATAADSSLKASGLSQGMEYWQVQGGRDKLETSAFSKVSKAKRQWGVEPLAITGSAASFSCSLTATWSQPSTPSSSFTGIEFKGRAGDGGLAGSLTKAPGTGGRWSGTLTWVRCEANTGATIFRDVVASDTSMSKLTTTVKDSTFEQKIT